MLVEQSRGDNLPKKCYITYINEQAKTRELEVVDEWDFSCDDARKWQRLPLHACGGTLYAGEVRHGSKFKFESYSNNPYVTCR